MAEFFSDDEIRRLLQEPKYLPQRWQNRLVLKLRAEISQKRASLIVSASSGWFRIMIRQNTIQLQDFSVILGFRRATQSDWFRLRRYNGPHPPRGEHRNPIEREVVRGFHIHMATQRYQERGFDPDRYAVASTAFRDYRIALELMLADCAFVKPKINEPEGGPHQEKLFPTEEE